LNTPQHLGRRLTHQADCAEADWTFRDNDDVLARLKNLMAMINGERTNGSIPEAFHAPLGQRPLLWMVEPLLITNPHLVGEIESGLCERHFAVLRLDDDRCAVLTLDPRQVVDVVQLHLRIDVTWHSRPDCRRHRLGKLRTDDEVLHNRRAFKHREKLCRPYALKVGVPVHGSGCAVLLDLLRARANGRQTESRQDECSSQKHHPPSTPMFEISHALADLLL